MKPVAAGATLDKGVLRNEDVEQLRAASNIEAPMPLVNPYCFRAPVSPHLAAAAEGVEISLDRVLRSFAALRQLADHVVVEGAGGFLVPLASKQDMGELARRIAAPVVLVVGMRLGCLNHALLTAEAIRHRGLTLAGWVANCIESRMDLLEPNIETLRARLPAALLGVVPHAAEPHADPGIRLRIEALADPHD
jgi:dethiobiotin synthetase